MLFHSVTCYTNFIISRIHVNTTKLCNITCTLVATGVILRSLGCLGDGKPYGTVAMVFYKQPSTL